MKIKHSPFVLLALSTLFFISTTYSQGEQSQNCFKRDGLNSIQLKSNSLSLSQIAQSEKYDVNFYALDIAMTNLVTDIAGTAEIHGTATEVLDSVLFELFSTHTISDLRLNGVSIPYTRINSAITVPVNLTSGQAFEIAIDYNGTPPTGATNPLGGSGMTNDSSPSWGNQVTWSLSEPFSAYEWWPCKQSLSDKADSCSIKITVPNICKAGSNGVLENVVDLGDGTSRYEWMHRHSIDYYLISVAVAQYVEYNVYANPAGSISPVLIQNYVYDNPGTLPNFQADIDETVDFIELFADLFGPYPFQDEKYGHCMAPLSGGMEHQTMTTQGWFAKGLTSHELGHQWWGDNVTCSSWADIWVNEGFASYSEYLMLENLYPNETTGHMNDVHNNVMSQNGGSVWCLDSLNEGRIFSGRLTYDKGAAIVHTFRFLMNDDVAFFQALKNIQTDFTGDVVSGLDIRDYFQAASGVDLTEAFNEWYFGQGYPTYSARWNTQGTDLLMEITHTTSSVTPLFTNDLEITFARGIQPDTTIRISIDANLKQFLIPNMGDVSQLQSIDPNNWIINKIGSIQNDDTFTSLGIEENTISTYSIAPNPSDGKFTLTSSENGRNRVTIIDIRGRTINSLEFEKELNFDLSKEEAGYYILQIENESGARRIKTIVKK